MDYGRVQVVIDGFNPLCFESLVEFDGGEETVVKLRYERLFGWCKICNSLCHNHIKCPSRRGTRAEDEDNRKDGHNAEPNMLSYKGAVTQGNKGVVINKIMEGPYWSSSQQRNNEQHNYRYNKGKGKARDDGEYDRAMDLKRQKNKRYDTMGRVLESPKKLQKVVPVTFLMRG